MEKIKLLQEALNHQEYDLIAVGRALLADPEWFVKILNGRENQILQFTKQALNVLS
jgi:2,4-dienoyl-CoA reductase-like NADH-dependent reductase (Old Yellow Enzyme family)